MPIHSLLALIVAVLLAGCTAFPRQQGPGPVSQVVLEKPVEVPEGRARAFLQDGAVVNNINEFRPHCALEIRHVSGPPRTVPPGSYAVTRIQDVITEVVLGVPRTRLASVGFGVFMHSGVSGRGDSPSDIFEGYHFWLADSAGVGLMRMTCLGTRAQPIDVEPPTLAEIAQALGEFGRLELGR